MRRGVGGGRDILGQLNLHAPKAFQSVRGLWVTLGRAGEVGVAWNSAVLCMEAESWHG